MNSKSASATVLVVILAVAIEIADGFCPFKKSSTGLTNIIQKFSGEWYVAISNNFGERDNINPETQCARQLYAIDHSTGSLTIKSILYKVSDGSVIGTYPNVLEKVNDDPKTNTEWKREDTGATAKLLKITSQYGVYTSTDKDGVYLYVLTKNAVITEKQLAEAKKIAKTVGFTGDELNRKFNTHCDKLPPIL